MRFADDALRAKLTEQQKHRYYGIACGAMSCIADHLDTKNYEMAERNFKLATGYSDADQLLDNLPNKLKAICYKKAENAIKKNCKNDYSELMTDKFYNEIYSLYRAAKDHEDAEEKFKNLPNLRDEAFANTARVYMYQSQWNTNIETAQKYISKVVDSKLKNKLNDEYAEQLKAYNYYWAAQYLAMDKSSEVNKAIKIYKELGDYEDSPEKLNEAKKKHTALKKKESIEEHNARINNLKSQLQSAQNELEGIKRSRKARLSDERSSFIAAIVHLVGLALLVVGILLIISSTSANQIIPIRDGFAYVQVFIENTFEIAVDTNIPLYVSIGVLVAGFIMMQVGSIIISVVNFGLWYLAFIGTCMYDVYVFCVFAHFFGYFKALRDDSGKTEINRCKAKIEGIEEKLKKATAKDVKTDSNEQ
jgi:tetratricopeptide (TPR) repeat protein